MAIFGLFVVLFLLRSVTKSLNRSPFEAENDRNSVYWIDSSFRVLFISFIAQCVK